MSAINETVITSTAATPASNNSNTTNNTATATDNDIGELREDMCNTPESILGNFSSHRHANSTQNSVTKLSLFCLVFNT